MDERRVLFNAEEFKKRMEQLEEKRAELEGRGELPDPLGFLARDAITAWASGESADNWKARSAVTERSIERLQKSGIWPWEQEPAGES